MSRHCPFPRRPLTTALLFASLSLLSFASSSAKDAHAATPKAESSKDQSADAAEPAGTHHDGKSAPQSGTAPKGARGVEKPEPDVEHQSEDRSGKVRKGGPEGKSAEPRAAKAPPKDSMDALREKLAERLGATASPHPRVVRVAARSPEADQAGGHATARPASAGSHARHSAAVPNAARLAAEHRASTGDGGSKHGSTSQSPHWDYKGDAGPQSWGRLKPEFAQCATGARQSPIDIRDGIKVQLDAVRFDYKPSGFRVIDNGHTVQVNVESGNSIEVIGRRYDLVQFHFHRPSEERINGRLFDMVAHLVHKDMEGRLAVVAVLLDRGSAHPIIQSVWNNLPLEKGEELPARMPLDLNALLPDDRRYYTYMGSLTTPPCSEGVLWMVMKNPVTISPEQIAIFSRLYPMNARPIQSASGRLIKESD